MLLISIARHLDHAPDVHPERRGLGHPPATLAVSGHLIRSLVRASGESTGIRLRRSGSIGYPAEAVESNFGSPVCERGVRATLTGPACLAVPVTGPCLSVVGRVLSSVAAGHPGGTRSTLDRFRETSIVDRRVRGDVPPHPLPSGERLFLIFPDEATAWPRRPGDRRSRRPRPGRGVHSGARDPGRRQRGYEEPPET